MAGGVLLGLAVPPLAAIARPLLVPALLIPLTLALLRIDWHAMGAFRRRPAVALALIGWILLVSPLAIWAVVQPLLVLGMPESLGQALVLMAAASPIVSCVALALFLDFDAALAIVAVLVTTALVPFTLPVLALALTGIEIELSLPAFMLRLALLVGSAFAVAGIARRLVAPAALAARRDQIDGLAVITLVVFALAIMDGVTTFAFARPAYVAMALAAAFASNLLLQAAGYWVFRRLGHRAALTAALVSGNCNMGLVLVALQDRASFEITAYFALAQIPMYTLPALLAPLYRRALARQAGVRS